MLFGRLEAWLEPMLELCLPTDFLRQILFQKIQQEKLAKP